MWLFCGRVGRGLFFRWWRGLRLRRWSRLSRLFICFFLVSMFGFESGFVGPWLRLRARILPCKPDSIRNLKCRSWSSQSISWRASSLKKVRLGTWTPPGKILFRGIVDFVGLVVYGVYSGVVVVQVCDVKASSRLPRHRIEPMRAILGQMR